MKNCAVCSNKFPSWIKIDGKYRNLKNRKYCLECSTFGKHNTVKLEKINNDFRTCPKCKQSKSLSDFYPRRGKDGSSCYCKICSNSHAIYRQRKFKINCVEYKGGSCSICGYNKCIGALEFHHKDPTKKDYTIANQRFVKFDDRIKKELDKCILVCANCHREIHGNLIDKKNGNLIEIKSTDVNLSI
jgi:hypothetical protein